MRLRFPSLTTCHRIHGHVCSLERDFRERMRRQYELKTTQRDLALCKTECETLDRAQVGLVLVVLREFRLLCKR